MKISAIAPIALLTIVFPLFSFSQEVNEIAKCKTSSITGTLGFSLIVRPPKNVKVKKGFDVDYGYYSIGYGPKKARDWLRGIYGPFPAGNVPENLTKGATDVTTRKWKSGRVNGVDSRGKDAGGKYWRYLGLWGEAIRYENASKESAKFFDGILDSICFIDKFR